MIEKELEIRNLFGLAGLLLLVLAICGCTPPERGTTLFAKEYLVAQGFEIDWTAKEKGTAFLVEEKANKVLKTLSLEEGGKFTFSVAGVSSEQQFRALFGVKFAEAEFCLYFFPDGQVGLNE